MDAYVFERKQYWISSIADTYPNTIYIYQLYYPYTYIHIYIYIYIYLYIYIYIERYTYIYVYTYIYTYTSRKDLASLGGILICLTAMRSLIRSPKGIPVRQRILYHSSPTKDSLSFLSQSIYLLFRKTTERQRGAGRLSLVLWLCTYMYVYIYIYMYICIHTLYSYMYTEREREGREAFR